MALIASMAIGASAYGADPEVIVDDLDTPSGWTGPVYEYGLVETGSGSIENGVMRIVHTPKAKWHSVRMEKTYPIRFSPGCWVHFRCRFEEMLLGADLYADLLIGDKVLCQLGVNGEQHWKMFHRCEEKEHHDEIFWGSPLIVGIEGGKNTDIRTGLAPESIAMTRFTEWTLFSVQYDAQPEGARIRVFVNGCEVVYRDLDMPAPQGVIDNRVAPGREIGPEGHELTVRFSNFTDGDLYADTAVNGGKGVRWLEAFASYTPARPHPEDPQKAVLTDAVMFWDYLIISPGSPPESPEPPIARLLAEGRLDRSVAQKVCLFHHP